MDCHKCGLLTVFPAISSKLNSVGQSGRPAPTRRVFSESVEFFAPTLILKPYRLSAPQAVILYPRLLARTQRSVQTRRRTTATTTAKRAPLPPTQLATPQLPARRNQALLLLLPQSAPSRFSSLSSRRRPLRIPPSVPARCRRSCGRCVPGGRELCGAMG